MTNPVGTLAPAYGRDYKSVAAAQADFDAGKDFTLSGPYGGGYINKDAYKGKGTVMVRFAKLTKTGTLKFG